MIFCNNIMKNYKLNFLNWNLSIVKLFRKLKINNQNKF